MKKLLDKYTDKQILTRLFEIYPDQKNSIFGYEKALKQLRKLKPVKSEIVIIPSKFNTYGDDGGEFRYRYQNRGRAVRSLFEV